MYYYLKRKSLKDLKEGNLLISLIKMFVAAGVMVLAVLAVRFGFTALGVDLTATHGVVLLVGAGICVGIAVYAIMIFALKLEETKMVMDAVKKKLKKA